MPESRKCPPGCTCSRHNRPPLPAGEVRKRSRSKPEPTRRCSGCGKIKSLDQFYPRADRYTGTTSRCRECTKAGTRRYQEANRDKINAGSRRWRAQNPDRAREKDRKARASNRAKVFDHYGWACACCGTTEDLCIDHLNGDGGAHRRELFGSQRGASGHGMYRWLIRSNFPSDFQTLCRPCNRSKGMSPRCWLPHPQAEPRKSA